MIPDWPSTLPPPTCDSWQLTRQDVRSKRQGETGPPGFRRRFTSGARQLSAALVLTRSEKAIFDTFFGVDCADGTRYFRMPDPSTNGWALLTSAGAPLLGTSGTPLLLSRRWLCAWGEQMPIETVVEQVKFQIAFSIVVIR